MYGRRWGKARREHLARKPWCRYCEAEGRTMVLGTVVDHIEPHNGDPVVFWNPDNWQTLCKRHHDGAKQAEEKGSAPRGCDAQGNPLDAGHHWNR